MILVAPTEPALLHKLGTTSSLPEDYGVDFLFAVSAGLSGIQRKEVRDLVASVRGDRIARELGQSTALEQTVLIVEGDWRWNIDGTSRAVDGWTRAQYDGLMLSFQQAGWWVMVSDSLIGTYDLIPRVMRWFAKDHHNTLRTRPKSRGLWGTCRNRDWGRHLWQSFDGIGIETAGNLYDALGVPLAWTVTEKELLKVPGVGKVRAKALMDALEADDG